MYSKKTLSPILVSVPLLTPEALYFIRYCRWYIQYFMVGFIAWNDNTAYTKVLVHGNFPWLSDTVGINGLLHRSYGLYNGSVITISYATYMVVDLYCGTYM